ncbi:MAG: Gfo/Idh/MocA family oxidoreductase, partial [Lysobacterales bacterium]
MTKSNAAGITNWPDDRSVRVGVIGAGTMGCNHLRVYDSLKNAELVGFYDPDQQDSKALAEKYRCIAFETPEEAAKAVDAVSICSPSTTHGRVGEFFLNAGVHCLIEKPLATNEAECRALIDLAARKNAKLLVGHIERFNPAIRQLSLMLAGRGQKIHAIDIRRLSAVSQRITDVDVVADLMVHDLDIVIDLAGTKVSLNSAAAVGAGSDRGADHVTALLDLGGDAIACLTASRITQHTVRRISVTTDTGLIEVDYINQSVEIYRHDRIKRTQGPAAQFGDYTLDIAMERVQVRRTEPLQLELSHFIDIIRQDSE